MNKQEKRSIKDYMDDLLVFLGCVSLCVGTYILCPVATWFVAGLLLIAGGIIIGAGRNVKREP